MDIQFKNQEMYAIVKKSLILDNQIQVLFRVLFCEFYWFLIESVAVFGSDDISLEGLQQELEECKNHDVSRSFSISFILS